VQIDDVSTEVSQGDPRNVLCEAVDKHRASILVLGSHGYGAVKRCNSIAPSYQLHCDYNVCVYSFCAIWCKAMLFISFNIDSTRIQSPNPLSASRAHWVQLFNFS